MNVLLLTLLNKEDELVGQVRLNEITYELYKGKNKHLTFENIEKLEKSKEVLLECRKEIAKYLDFLKTLSEN